MDAVVFGDLMITLLKNADRVKAASLAQLVNVIAPIMTQKGGDAWRQTTFYPFALTAKLTKGGTVLEPKQSSTPIAAKAYGEVESVNSVVVKREDGSHVILLTNRSLEQAADVEISLPHAGFSTVEATTVHDDDMYAANTADNQNRVTPSRNTSAQLDEQGERVTLTLPAVSWTAVEVK